MNKMWMKCPFPYDNVGQGEWFECDTPYLKYLWHTNDEKKPKNPSKLPTMKSKDKPND